MAANLQLLCHAHNRLAAERHFGIDVMNRYARREQVSHDEQSRRV